MSYQKLLPKLEKDYVQKLKESESLQHEYDSIRKDYVSYTNKISSLLDVLSFLSESLGKEEQEESKNPIQKNEKDVSVIDDKERIESLLKINPKLTSLDKLLHDEFNDVDKLRKLKDLLLFNDTSNNHFDSFVDWIDNLGILTNNGKKRALEESVINGNKKRKT